MPSDDSHEIMPEMNSIEERELFDSPLISQGEPLTSLAIDEKPLTERVERLIEKAVDGSKSKMIIERISAPTSTNRSNESIKFSNMKTYIGTTAFDTPQVIIYLITKMKEIHLHCSKAS